MPRRFALLLASVATVAIVGCNATPAAPALTDPKEILTKSVEAVSEAKSFHIATTVSGTFNADLMGSGSATEFKLDGTTLDGDVDVVGKKAKLTFRVPALLGLSGEVIQIDQTSYLKTSLTGAKYQKTVSSDVPVDEVTDPAKSLADLQEFLDRPGVSPTKIADAKCGDNKDCYQVEIDLDGAELAALASEAPDLGTGTDLEEGSLKMVVGVEKDTLRPSKLTMSVSAGEDGSFDITMNLTKWDASVTIDEPPAGEVTEG